MEQGVVVGHVQGELHQAVAHFGDCPAPPIGSLRKLIFDSQYFASFDLKLANPTQMATASSNRVVIG